MANKEPRTVLAFARALRKTTQKQLADYAHIDATALSAVENCRRTCPEEARKAIAEYFKVPERRLFDEKGWAEEM
jgi:transcriptional regulator with XRE-family HTH domain